MSGTANNYLNMNYKIIIIEKNVEKKNIILLEWRYNFVINIKN